MGPTRELLFRPFFSGRHFLELAPIPGPSGKLCRYRDEIGCFEVLLRVRMDDR
jgi:hypothetical protein